MGVIYVAVLNKSEHSIFGFFASSTKAQRAMDELKRQSGMVMDNGSIQIDRISRFGVVNDSDYNNPINNALNEHAVTTYSNSLGVDDGLNPLIAANDSESGRGINDDNLAGEAYMVTLVTDKANIDTAVAIMKANGGKV
jgi:hypothetical protein